MIAVDACVVISFLAGETMSEVESFAALLRNDRAILAPSTVAELLSDPKGGARTARMIDGLKTLPILEGYWRRAGLLRATVKGAGRKAALGDALAAQACLDSDVPLLTCDADFKAFAEVAKLKLAA
jgi:predicted nucleic acid-binding protein